MISVDVGITNLTTGEAGTLCMPDDDIPRNADKYSEYIVNSESIYGVMFPDSVMEANDALSKFNSAGLTIEEAAALVIGCGGNTFTDSDVLLMLDSGEYSVYDITDDVGGVCGEDDAARWIATELYVPFGDLTPGDMVLIEDKLSDYMEWSFVWSEYELAGYSCVFLSNDDEADDLLVFIVKIT